LKFSNFGGGVLKGMMVTFRNFIRRPITTQFPNERLTVSRRTRGNEIIWGRARCTGCGTCARTCPQGAIEIETKVNPADNTLQVVKYRVDTGYCIQCGLCVEACPYQTLYMGYPYERAKYRRSDLVQQGAGLLESAKRPASGFQHPEVAAKLPEQTLLLERDQKKK